MSQIPLRFKFSLVVAAIAGAVVSGLALLVGGGTQPPATVWLGVGGGLVMTLLVDQAARRLVFRRLIAIRLAMQQAAAGQVTVRVPVERPDEIGVIERALNDILQGLEHLNDAANARVDAAAEIYRRKTVEIADSHHEMAMLSDELARAGRLAALGQAAANMAHQIGTPLNLISTHVQLLIQSTAPTAPSIDRLKAIQDQVAKVTTIVRAALDSLRPSLAPHERAELGILVRQVCQMAGPMLEEAGVEIEVVTPREPVEVVADAVQLELALLNLLTNSVDAMPAGGRLRVRLDRADQRLRLSIEDTGTGVPPELLGRIFDPWVTTKPHGKGSGLGLSIARQVVVAHGGTICVDNRTDNGAVFTIDLPAAPALQSPAMGAHAEDSDRR